MNPVLSIITINFNNAAGLQKTIESVIEQNFGDFEFILIDGASTDGSLKVLDKYSKHLSNCISEKDSGIYNAMNKGIKVAKGDFLLFLNSGDTLTGSNALQEFVQHPSFEGDIIYGDYKFEKGEKIYPDELYPSYFMKTSLPHQSTFFRKSVFEVMGLFDEKYKIGADRAFYIKCYLSGKLKFQHVRYFLTLFDLSGVSNDPEFIAKKKREDELLLREQYGSKYQEYKEELELEIQRNAVPRNSFRGIFKRIKKRIQKLWARS